jgi:outer membrane protein assembly factor BamD
MIRRESALLVLLFTLLIAVSGCSGGDRIQALGPEEAFVQGKELYDRGRYIRAIEYFQRVFDTGRGHQWAADAQYYLAQSYFNSRQYLLAANSFTRFVEFYRTDERAEEGEFMRALSYVRLSPPYQLDQTDTRNALTYLHLYLSRYPQGQHVDEALSYIEEMREKLSRQQFEIAELYERRGQFQAAAIEYLRLLETHPDSEFADDSLLGAMRSYKAFADRSIPQRRAERYLLAAEQYERLTQLFPQSPLLPEANALHEEVRQELARYGTAAAQ